MTEPVELIVFACPAEGIAGQALTALQKLARRKTIRLVNTAVLVKSRTGKLTTTDPDDVNAPQGALLGAVVGGLVGLLGGPAGVVVGAAAGAAAGGAAAHKLDLGFSDAFLQQAEHLLQPGSSVLLVLVERPWVSAVQQALAVYPGQFLKHELKTERTA